MEGCGRGSKTDPNHISGDATQSRDLFKMSDASRGCAATPVTEFTFDSLPQISFDPLQEWEGRVVEVKGDRFFANLLDITAGKHFEEEIAEFPLDDVSDIDRPLLRSGAVFRWLIGYARRSSGTKYRVSNIVFRRLPQWTSIDIVRAETEGDKNTFVRQVGMNARASNCGPN